jgi:hypothetical protein
LRYNSNQGVLKLFKVAHPVHAEAAEAPEGFDDPNFVKVLKDEREVPLIEAKYRH